MAIRPIRVVIQGVDKFSAFLNDSSKGIEKFGKKVDKIGKSMTRNVTLPLVGLGTAGVIASTKLNQGMAQVASLIPGNTKRVNELKESVKDLSVESGKGLEDLSAGLFQTISAFGDSAETVDRFNVGLRASVAGAADTQATISLLSSVTKAYGDTSVEALKKVSDLAFKTNELGETSFPELAANMGKVNSIAGKMKVSQEELFAVIATATGPLGNTADVTTKLKAVLTSMLKPTEDMKIAYKKLGVANGEQLIKQEGFQGALQKIVGIAEKYNVDLGKLIGSAEGLQVAFSLTGAQSEKFAENLEKLKSSAGSTEKAFKEMTEGVNGAGFTFQQFKQLSIVAASEIGDAMAPTLAKITMKLMGVIKWFRTLSPGVKKFIIIVGAIAAAVGPVLVVFAKVIGAFMIIWPIVLKIIGVLKLLGAAFALLSNPIGWIILAIGAVVAILKLFGLKWSTIFKILFPPVWALIKVIKLIWNNWDLVVKNFVQAKDAIVGVAKVIWDKLKPIRDIVKEIVDGIGKVISKAKKIGVSIAENVAGGGAQPFGFNPALLNQPAPENVPVPVPAPGSTNKQEVLVKFDQPPAGTRIERISGDMDIETSRGGLLPALGG